MMLPPNPKRVFLAVGSTDMRKSINGLSVLVERAMEMNPFDGDLFVFCNRRRNMIKILYWDKNGFALWHKRLEKHRFHWPTTAEQVVSLGSEELEFIKELYRIEKYARRNELTIEQIRDLRQEKSKPILDRFKIWLDTYHSQVPPKSLLGQAIQYTLNQWDRLVVYIKAGFLKPDNNAAENAIRPFVLDRKNWLFAGGPKGAEASAVFFSLIETAKANGLEPYTYLRYLFENIPFTQNESDFLELLPNRIDKAELNASAMGAVD
ncbi:hypothetical protein DSCO28_37960 [Desulfosarcina ovata subsp. sediminis]|uniref:Transposase IS66 C-terminal domain-containing protein n=1 Tax=Desulfosarcina ovata subsp. sediminis TaxID=885957 RepID=A0A5K7ZSP9_9BACT|nr:IS66 family insertion sequence element accessory protein TnpB [Desulfosarcina ovata]BBO83230.1 hypothetical protein DSCO28_37960 [Desulfosarcina ovata subsp. sediminis]